MYFDLEMLLIHVVAILSGLIFYAVASRDPRRGNSDDSSTNIYDTVH